MINTTDGQQQGIIQSILQELGTKQSELGREVEGISKNIEDIVNANRYSSPGSLEQQMRNLELNILDIRIAIKHQDHLDQILLINKKEIEQFINEIMEQIAAAEKDKKHMLMDIQISQFTDLISYLNKQDLLKEILFLNEKIAFLKERLIDINLRLATAYYDVINDLKSIVAKDGYIAEYNIRFNNHELLDYVKSTVRDKVSKGEEFKEAFIDAHREWYKENIPIKDDTIRNRYAEENALKLIKLIRESPLIKTLTEAKKSCKSELENTSKILTEKTTLYKEAKTPLISLINRNIRQDEAKIPNSHIEKNNAPRSVSEKTRPPEKIISSPYTKVLNAQAGQEIKEPNEYGPTPTKRRNFDI